MTVDGSVGDREGRVVVRDGPDVFVLVVPLLPAAVVDGVPAGLVALDGLVSSLLAAAGCSP